MKTTPTTVRLDTPTLKRMAAVQREFGTLPSEQIRRALAAWLSSQEQFIGQLHGSLKLAKGAK